MGAGSSDLSNSHGNEGYHVLRVQHGSPGHKAGLQAFFDFVVAMGDTKLSQDNEVLKELLRSNKDKPINLTIFNSKTQSFRNVDLVPSQDWGGQGLLGVSIRYCSFEGANENVWHVLDIDANSPASLSGLNQMTDYIIGAETVLNDSEEFFNLIETHDGQTLKLYVYNIETDSCREVTITPNSSWGGDGLIGCGIGYGYLHRIPTLPFSMNLKSADSCCGQPKSHETGATNHFPEMTNVTDGFSEIVLTDEKVTKDTKPLNAEHQMQSHPFVMPIPPQPLPENAIKNMNSESSACTIDFSSHENQSHFPPVSTNIVIPGMPPLNVQVGSISMARDNNFSKDHISESQIKAEMDNVE